MHLTEEAPLNLLFWHNCVDTAPNTMTCTWNDTETIREIFLAHAALAGGLVLCAGYLIWVVLVARQRRRRCAQKTHCADIRFFDKARDDVGDWMHP
jgi:hypothetical protein